MLYKTIVIGCTSKAKKIAAAVEKVANEQSRNGWELVTFNFVNSGKLILVFRTPEMVLVKEPVANESDEPKEETAEESAAETETVLPEETAEAVGDAE